MCFDFSPELLEVLKNPLCYVGILENRKLKNSLGCLKELSALPTWNLWKRRQEQLLPTDVL